MPARTRKSTGETVEVVRLNVNINPETAAALRAIAAQKGISYTEAIRRAVAVYKFVEDEMDDGNKIQSVNDKEGKTREIVLA